MVYITNNSGHDFDAARVYGEFSFLTEGFIPWDKLNLAYRQMAEGLKDSQPDDWLLLTGPTSICCVACAIMGHLHGKINLLVYDKGGFYQKHQLVINSLV